MRVLFLILLLLFAGTCQAHSTDAEKVGMVVAMRGVVNDDNGPAIMQGAYIYEGCEITTSEKSFAVIQFDDGSKLTVRPDSVIIIKHYTMDGAELELVSGGLRLITGLIGKENPDNYKVRTPVALMGVRGTEFSIQFIEGE